MALTVGNDDDEPSDLAVRHCTPFLDKALQRLAHGKFKRRPIDETCTDTLATHVIRLRQDFTAPSV